MSWESPVFFCFPPLQTLTLASSTLSRDQFGASMEPSQSHCEFTGYLSISQNPSLLSIGTLYLRKLNKWKEKSNLCLHSGFSRWAPIRRHVHSFCVVSSIWMLIGSSNCAALPIFCVSVLVFRFSSDFRFWDELSWWECWERGIVIACWLLSFLSFLLEVRMFQLRWIVRIWFWIFVLGCFNHPVSSSRSIRY